MRETKTYKKRPINNQIDLSNRVSYQRLRTIYQYLEMYCNRHSRVMIFHFQLKAPSSGYISEQLQHELTIKFLRAFSLTWKDEKRLTNTLRKMGTHKQSYCNHNYDIQYIWRREQNEDDGTHYHIYIFANGNILRHFESIKAVGLYYWHKILRVNSINIDHLSHNQRQALFYIHCEKGNYLYYNGFNAIFLDRNAEDYEKQKQNAFQMLSYCVKDTQKTNDSIKRNFGTSRF